jgi:hypothetical protein
MRVRGWTNGTYGYGVSVGRANANAYFPREWRDVELEVAGKVSRVRLTRTFWTTCPELRAGAIGRWLKHSGLTSWPVRRPPQLTLTPLGKNRFSLSI